MTSSIKDGDNKILSYHDVVLRRSDLGILRGPHYLNDRLIEFYFAHLASSSGSSGAVFLVPPSISFWLANCSDSQSLREFADPLRLPDRSLVLFTVNDNLDVDVAEGGSHWSLLVYCRETSEFVHHDSCSGINLCHAQRLFRAVSGFVGASEPPQFVEGFTPQQTNGYDCGLYVLAISEVVCNWFVAGGRGCAKRDERWFTAVDKEVDAVAVKKLRGEVLKLILSLMENK
ncbi:NEDD8-specific protease 1-like [Zingiber officinale]|uniref:NEDD8-specific protease 1-like n=1 Tax=Zingiber officinale TaxID=94328 RepID=UPI001C4C7BF3|nr:NEDD8-specific protease 1-like [Zingiber officinale]XP_042374206.1 NEDD8-specific protease 1-like [Zingiber officinale]XP_042374207.1 NEDD8-specific protease 1-like [Zingiber officinale]XP_042374208.1 NEDD8-specific protease 1-like [Zingiber officinale]